MATVIAASDRLTIPNAVTNIDAFREWNDSPDFPNQYQVWWLCGGVWIDMSKEQIFSHILVKTEIARVLGGLVKAEKLGLFLTDGLLLSNFEADISGNPDSTFISTASRRDSRVRMIEGAIGGYVELQGSPDMVLEILSDSSVQKDTIVLREAYWKAGVREYWVIDARSEPARFDIFRHGPKAFAATRKSSGWVKSNVFGRSFRLVAGTDEFGEPDFSLEHR